MSVASVTDEMDVVPSACRVHRVRGWIEALSPLTSFGDEKTGSTPLLRAIRWWVPAEADFVTMPYISGNAIRGMTSRLLARDMLARIGMEPDHLSSRRLAHFLFSGGVLESKDEEGGLIDLGLRTELRETVPLIGLFGGALENQMWQGCLKCMHALPLCQELAHLIGDERHAHDPRLEHPVRAFTDVTFHTRRDDVRGERSADEQAVQMKVDFQVFVPGTRFVHEWALVHPSDLELAAFGQLLQLWETHPWLGGKSGSGHGRVALHYDAVPDPQPYLDYLANEAARVRQALQRVDRAVGKG